MNTHPNTKHGMYGTPTYNSWAAMKQRCFYEKNIGYSSYGGRGITVCDKWLTFEGFFEDMGIRPDGTTLDRYPDSDGNYEPGNCRWATPIQQANNASTNQVISVNDECKTLSEWARDKGLNNGSVIAKRIERGWSVRDAINLPLKTQVNAPGGKETQFKPKYITHNGVTRSLKEWAMELGFSTSSALGKRLASGLPLSVALTPPMKPGQKIKR